MSVNLREALKQSLQGISSEELRTTIESGITSGKESVLPGLGVLFEQYYLSLDNSQKENWMKQLSKLLR
ncbi:MAG TPA: small, acid-soluble spore protein I [Candidatus Fimiplasma intestinipullorum]|uniref:Small, acid-soluble spore protein I n=1 Tax=Candidatus Fimiplasma intestinipullorum TaxID=2840825 RepID=A0A9D1HN99_9FIRM|nr:small, acid-soluble spore protein I [Candidatus Fimiplasma intestinipullorum]